MPRPALNKRILQVYISPSLDAELSLHLLDPLTGRCRYQAKSLLVEKLLRQHLTQIKRNTPNVK